MLTAMERFFLLWLNFRVTQVYQSGVPIVILDMEIIFFPMFERGFFI